MKEYTSPPCEACGSHEALQANMDDLTRDNTSQHRNIGKRLDEAMGDIHWIKGISKAILVTMLMYLLSVGYYIFTIDTVKHNEVSKIKQDIKEGETLHYKNERSLHNIEGQLKILINEVVKK